MISNSAAPAAVVQGMATYPHDYGATCPRMPSLGVYVMGALDDDERALVDLHLADCAECRQELERLLPLPRYLASLTTDDFHDSVPPSAGLLRRVRAAIGAERRRLARRRIVAAATVAVVVAAAAAALLVAGGPPTASRAAAADVRTGVSAAVALTPRAWGTEVSVRTDGAAPGELCRLVVRGRDGSREIAATWRATYDGSAGARGSTAIARADVSAVDVVTAAGRRLVHVPIPAP